ncbi:translesion error-prone DNA polymerase V autoproteolytic subunit [Accumulibacter sp.]|uniref:LexA family protein n=1 Tax=Accumulibacter sp. TaxID=2053492 RepID=UPI003314B5C5
MRLPESQVAAVLDFVKARAQLGLASLSFVLPAEAAERIELPVFATAIRAGFPSPADDYVEHRLDLNDLVLRKESTYYAWVEGDSMIDFGIHDGDLLMIDKSVQPQSGDIVVAEVDGFFTVKKVGNGVLLAGNPAYQALAINPEVGITVWGVVVRVIHDFRQRPGRRNL